MTSLKFYFKDKGTDYGRWGWSEVDTRNVARLVECPLTMCIGSRPWLASVTGTMLQSIVVYT